MAASCRLSGRCGAGSGRGSCVGRAGKTNHTSTEPGASLAPGHSVHHHKVARLRLCSAERGRRGLRRAGSVGRRGGLGGSSRTRQRGRSPPAHGVHRPSAASRVHGWAPKGSDNSPCVSPRTQRGDPELPTAGARHLPEEGASLSIAVPCFPCSVPAAGGRLAAQGHLAWLSNTPLLIIDRSPSAGGET